MRIFLLLLMLCGFQVFAERLPSVTDLTGTLTTEEQTALTQQLQTLEQQNHFQVAVLVTPTTGGKNIKLAASQRYGYITGNPLREAIWRRYLNSRRMAGRAGVNEDWTWTGRDVAAGTSCANCSLPYAARIRKKQSLLD